MELNSTKSVPASVEATYAALTDAQFLKDCIPGCETIEDAGNGRYLVTLAAKVGPVSARFGGSMTIVDPRPPTAYKLVFEGKGGAAGFAKGSADVTLAPEASGSTSMTYSVQAQVGGKLAQVGARLIEGAARKVADEFFGAFIAKMEALAPSPAAVVESAGNVQPVPHAAAGWKIAAIGTGIVVVAALVWLAR